MIEKKQTGFKANLFLTFIPFLVWSSRYLFQDLWWDEIIALKAFALTDITKAVTLYLKFNGNHHTFFHILNNLYLSISGITTLVDVYNNIFFVRFFPFIFGIIAIYSTFLAGKRLHSTRLGILAGTILSTTMPFLNFSLQIRSYCQSTAFCALVLYSYFSYVKLKKNRYLMYLYLTSTMLMYSTISNVYLICSLLLFVVINSIFLFIKNKTDMRKNGVENGTSKGTNNLRLYLGISIVLFLSIVTFLLLYMPLLDDFLAFRFANDYPDNRFYIFTSIFPHYIISFFGHRHLLVFVLLSAILLSFIQLKSNFTKPNNKETAHIYFLLIGLFIFPFLFSFLRNEAPFQRTFVYLTPILSLIVSHSIIIIFSHFHSIRVLNPSHNWFLILFIFYCYAMLFVEYNHIQQKLSDNIKVGIRDQNIRYNYYLSEKFTIKKNSALLHKIVTKNPGLVMLYNEVDRVSLGFYLDHHNIDYFCNIGTISSPYKNKLSRHLGKCLVKKAQNSKIARYQLILDEQLDKDALSYTILFYFMKSAKVFPETGASFYVITAFPDILTKNVEKYFPNLTMKRITPNDSYFNIFQIHENT